MSEDIVGPALLSIDFQRVFSHKFWISQWSSDDENDADRFRYKILSTRSAADAELELLVVLQKGDGTKEVLTDIFVGMDAFDRVAAVFVNGLAEEYGLDFQEQDFTVCTSSEAFEATGSAYGWRISDV